MRKLEVKFKEYNNKNRQGTHILIRDPKNKKEYTLLKFNGNFPVDYYIQYHLQKVKLPKGKRKKKPTPKKFLQTYDEVIKGTAPIKTKKKEQVVRDAEKYLKKVKKRYGGKTIEKMLKKGIQSVIIKDTHRANNHTINMAYKQLLQDLVLDKKVLDILATEENMKKMANRLEHRITIKNQQGENIIEATKLGITTHQAVKELNNLIATGQEIKYKHADTLKEIGYNNVQFQDLTKKNLGRTELIIILRKAK